MREIKFRAWNTDYKEMWHWKDVKQSTPIRLLEEANNVVFMQYTGLKDKNGKEIYEGDIDEYSKTQVIYLLEEGGFCLARFDEKGRVSARTRLNNGNEKCLEVIGNIYENPELL